MCIRYFHQKIVFSLLYTSIPTWDVVVEAFLEQIILQHVCPNLFNFLKNRMENSIAAQ